MKRGKSVVLALMIIVILGCSFFVIEKSITGNVTFVGPYKVYEGKTKEVKIGSNIYNIEVKSVLNSNTATLNVAGTSQEVTESSTSTIGNLQIKVIYISSKTGGLDKPYVKFSVAETDGVSLNNGDNGESLEKPAAESSSTPVPEKNIKIFTFVGPYKVYEGKTKTVKIFGNSYDVEVISISSDAALFVVDNSEATAVSKGQTKQVGNLQIKVISASLETWLNNANVKFSVAESKGVSTSSEDSGESPEKSVESSSTSSQKTSSTTTSSSEENVKNYVDNSKRWSLCIDSGNKINAKYHYGFLYFRSKYETYSDDSSKNYACDGKKPYYTEKITSENIAQTPGDNILMEECAIDCIKEKCDEISDSRKKAIALEQYSINCDENSCQENSCAKKIAINHISFDGSGTEENPYQIKDCLQLESVSLDLDANYILVNNIDCVDTINWDNGKGFEPIGYLDTSRYMDSCFKGKFNGNGYVVYNLFIGRPIETGIGLFACIYNAELNNLILINSNINGGSVTGGLVGSIGGDRKNSGSGIITNSVFNGRVTGMNKIGGLTGENYGLISDSYSSGNLIIEKDFSNAGGLVGYNYEKGIVQNSYSISDINGQTEVGGLVGYNSGIIKNSFFSGNIYGNGSYNMGFLVGINSNIGKIQNSYYYSVSNLKCVGDSGKGAVENCYSQKDINYFKSSVKNKEPFSKWDFVNNWKEVEDDYPLKEI